MRIKSAAEILTELSRSKKKRGWASASLRASDHAEEIYVAHPGMGLYQIRIYQKSPYEQVGVGAKIARKVDEGLMEGMLKESKMKFGVLSFTPRRIARAAKLMEEGRVHESFNSLIAVGGPSHGTAYVEELRELFPEENIKIKEEFRKKAFEESFRHYG